MISATVQVWQFADRSGMRRRLVWIVEGLTESVPCKLTWAAVFVDEEVGLGKDVAQLSLSCNCTHQFLCPCMSRSWRQKSKEETIARKSEMFEILKTHLMNCANCDEDTQESFNLHDCSLECCAWLKQKWLWWKVLINSTFYTKKLCANDCNYSKHVLSSSAFTNMFVKNIYLKITIA